MSEMRPNQLSALGFDLTPPDASWTVSRAKDLDPETRRILREHGTEPPFCGVFLDNPDVGHYGCGFCGLPLFESGEKFDSGTGWPSFSRSVDPEHVRYVRDDSWGMVRTEIRCGRCDSHLGHVFPDGPPPTFRRYCLNSAALTFTRRGEPTPDWLDRGGPEGRALDIEDLG